MANTKVQLSPQIEVHHPLELKLESWPIDISLITSGEPRASGVVLHKSADGKTADGVWECTPGSFRWNYTWDETVYILKGRFSIVSEGGERIHLQAGDVVHFPNGLRATWEIAETVRKVFSLSSNQVLDL